MLFNKQEFAAKLFFIITVLIPFITLETAFYDTVWLSNIRVLDIFLDPNHYPKLFIFNIFVLVFAIYLLFSKSKWNNKLIAIFKNKIIISYIVFAFISLLSIFWAISASLAIASITKVFLFLFFIIIATLLLSSILNYRLFISKILSSIGLIVSIIALIQILLLSTEANTSFDHQFTYLIKSVFSHRNLLSQVLLLILPFSFIIAIQNKGFWRWQGIITTILVLFLISFLLVRSVWIGFIISSIISLIAYLYFVNGKLQIFKFFNFKRILIILSIALIIIISIFSIVRNDESKIFQKQFSWITKNPFGSVKERIILWQASANMIKDKPITGVGTGNWGINLQKYSQQEARHQSVNTYYNFQRAHNDYLQIAAEIGILGLAAFILIFAFAIYYIIRILQQNNNANKLFAIALLFSLISYLVVSLFSFPNERAGSSIIISIILISIISISIEESNFQNNKLLQSSLMIIIIAFSGFSIITYTNILNGEINTKKALQYKLQNNQSEVINSIKEAYSQTYKVDPSSTPIKWYSATAYFLKGDIDNAFQDFKQGEIDAPYHKHNLNDLATCYVLKSQQAKAIKYYKRAIALSPHFDEALVNLAIVKYNQNQIDSAYYFIRECFIDNSNTKYEPVLNVLLPKITQAILIKFMNNEIMKSTISGILNSNEWMLNIHKQSIRTNRSYEKQLIEDVIYLHETIEKDITSEQANKLRIEFGG